MKYPITRPVMQLYRPAATLHIRPRTAGNYAQECNHVYAEAHGMGLVMDIFRPEGAPNGLGVVDVVSGGWYSDRVQLNSHLGLGVMDVLCGRGFTVFAVSPGSVTKFTGFNMVRHVQEAIRHIKTHAADFAVDPGRLGLMGVSAGGHLAALAALNPRPAHPHSRDPFRMHDTAARAAALFFAPTDLLDYGGRLFDYVQAEDSHLHRLLVDDGAPPSDPQSLRELLEALSPARQAHMASPPFLLIHGDADTIVPVSQSEKLAAALRAAGGEADVIIKPGGGHPWPDIRPEIEATADWFAQRL